MLRPALAVPVLALALLTGCSGSSSDSASTAAGADTARAADTSGAGGGAAAEVAPASAPRAQAPLEGRSLVRTADLTVRVPDVRAAADRAAEVARGSGGAVAGEESGDARAELRLQVPPARLDDALARLARLGDEQSRTVSTDDVTEQVVDLESRLATQRASVARVRALLERAGGLGDVVRIEGELAKREADLESLDARARALGARVELAVLTVHLTEEGSATAAAAAPGFRSGLDGGWRAATASARVLATVTGALLPFLPLLLVGLGVLRWRQRRTA